MRVVKRVVPASESRPEKSKKGLYQIVDPFLSFWFRYVHPHRGSLELGLADAVLAQRVRPTFDQFVGYAFEDAARGFVALLARAGALPFLPERIGAWWGRDGEIGVVAVSDAEGAMLVGECKWSVNPVGLNVLVDLQRKAQVLGSSGRWPQISCALFAKAGFTSDLQVVASSEGVRLAVPADLVGGDVGV